MVAYKFSSNTWEAETERTGAYLDYIRLCPISFASTFEKILFFNYTNVCLYVSMCLLVHMPSEARGERSCGAGVTGGCALPHVTVGIQLVSSTKAVCTSNH